MWISFLIFEIAVFYFLVTKVHIKFAQKDMFFSLFIEGIGVELSLPKQHSGSEKSEPPLTPGKFLFWGTANAVLTFASR